MPRARATAAKKAAPKRAPKKVAKKAAKKPAKKAAPKKAAKTPAKKAAPKKKWASLLPFYNSLGDWAMNYVALSFSLKLKTQNPSSSLIGQVFFHFLLVIYSLLSLQADV